MLRAPEGEPRAADDADVPAQGIVEVTHRILSWDIGTGPRDQVDALRFGRAPARRRTMRRQPGSPEPSRISSSTYGTPGERRRPRDRRARAGGHPAPPSWLRAAYRRCEARVVGRVKQVTPPRQALQHHALPDDSGSYRLRERFRDVLRRAVLRDDRLPADSRGASASPRPSARTPSVPPSASTPLPGRRCGRPYARGPC